MWPFASITNIFKIKIHCNAKNDNLQKLSYLALCIHVSPECREVLEQLGGYHLEERGEVEMKVLVKATITKQ